MKAQVSTAVAVLVGAAVLSTVAGASPQPTAAAKGEPRVRQMVVLGGKVIARGTVVAKRTRAKVGRRSCAVAAATPLAALLRARPGPIRLRDYGSCSSRPGDGAGLFVRSIRGKLNKGLDGWVYKVGRKLGTAGAADPAGPFGSGRLRERQHVVWFYCQFANGSCQRALELRQRVEDGRLSVTVTGYDDAGEGVAIAGATVVAGEKPRTEATTGADGQATVALPPGRYELRASKSGLIPSFPVKVEID